MFTLKDVNFDAGQVTFFNTESDVEKTLSIGEIGLLSNLEELLRKKNNADTLDEEISFDLQIESILEEINLIKDEFSGVSTGGHMIMTGDFPD